MQFTTALLVLVLSTAAIAQINTDSNVQLRGISQTSDRVDIETYDNEVGLGITVSSTEQSLLITSSTGEVLVHYKKPFYKERNGEELDQLIVFNGQQFLVDLHRISCKHRPLTERCGLEARLLLSCDRWLKVDTHSYCHNIGLMTNMTYMHIGIVQKQSTPQTYNAL